MRGKWVSQSLGGKTAAETSHFAPSMEEATQRRNWQSIYSVTGGVFEKKTTQKGGRKSSQENCTFCLMFFNSFLLLASCYMSITRWTSSGILYGASDRYLMTLTRCGKHWSQGSNDTVSCGRSCYQQKNRFTVWLVMVPPYLYVCYRENGWMYKTVHAGRYRGQGFSLTGPHSAQQILERDKAKQSR